ncbi:membrane protein [Mycobacterium phage Pharaoh]|uniref:Membrane protein n=1 Tax=Mycobacterium phage Pharaoh TaxID=2530140 RepID=A0A481W1R5_9CAUD|nr:membrane protein [Mycobacterium phage Pharaoh]QBJ00253.1 membrane protein [Mycobacterium phage Pharaoh]
MPLPIILFVVFLVLKLIHKIDWSWVWVTSPLWISAGLVGLFYLVTGLFAAAIYRKASK